MTFTIHANLGQEAEWSGVPLPAAVQNRISAAGSLVAALAPDDDDVIVWTPTQIDPARLRAVSGWTPPQLRSGTPTSPDLTWCDVAAKSVNDRRFGVRVAREAGLALAGVQIIASIDELRRHLEAGGADASGQRSWVCKAPWTSAGRDRCFGVGPVLDSDVHDQIRKLLAQHSALVFEPWLDRIDDFGACGRIDVAGLVSVLAPHRLLTTRRGGFRGIELATPMLEVVEHDLLVTAANVAGHALHHGGYVGPFGIDAFVYRDRGERRLHALCEINARYTFGHVAHALARKLGISSLRLGTAAPRDAAVVVAPGITDPSLAWVT